MCKECEKPKRYDLFSNFKEGNDVCKVCEKSGKGIKSQSIQSQSGKYKLTANSLKTLPEKSLVGSKRQYSSISGYQSPAQEQVVNEQHIQEQSFHQHTLVSDIQMSEASGIQTVQSVQYVVVTKTDLQTIKLLKDLEVSELGTTECAQQVQIVCDMFAQEVVVGFFNSGVHPKLSEYIIKVLKRSDQLEDNQIVGLLIASFNIGNACWTSAVKLLIVMDDERRQTILQMFQICLCKQYKEEIANWCCKYWRQVEQQHINLMKYLHINSTTVDSGVLIISLTVVLQEQQRFIQFVSAFISSAPVAQMVIDTIVNRPHQSKMTFDLLDKLIDILQDKSFASIIDTIKGSLFGLQLCKWVEEIEQSKASSNIIDSASIQIFLDELINAYGEIKTLQKDLTQTDDFRFELLLSTASKVPNARQFAQAQYCIGKLYQQQRQLCIVPSGQGKSRIAATVAAIGLMCEMFTKIHMVFDNKHLLDRDHADFEDYWILLSYGEEQCQYHIDIDFKVEPNELVIIDEADIFMFKDPIKFQQFTSECACICFTATPDNQQANGLEAKVVTSLKFEKFHYILDPDIQKINLDFDKEIDCKTLEEKAAFIKDQSSAGPVLVYCDASLTEQLTNLDCSILMMEQSVDPEVLRQLDEKVNGSYRVVIAQDQFAMRGIDYRSTNATMTLVIAKSFENQREATQGFNRVGRFGDQCCRVRFSDVQFVDKKTEMMYNASLMKFVCEMQKKPTILKPVTVKIAQTAKPKTSTQPKPTTSYVSKSMDKKRIVQLLGQTTISFEKKTE